MDNLATSPFSLEDAVCDRSLANCGPALGRPGRARRRPVFAAGPASLLAASLSASLANAQAPRPVERNLPPLVTAPTAAPSAPLTQQSVQDAQPLGGVLRTIRLYGPGQALLAEGAPVPAGVVVGDLGPAAKLDFRQVLGVYVGKPLSRKLIRDVQIAATRVYRRAGYPFVAVVAPPQELTGGVLQLQVTEFRSAGVTVNGGAPAAQARVLAQAPLPPGARLQSSAVDEDFDWMARYPYRRVQGVFSPGDEVGESRLTLNVTDTKPWQVFAGASNTGTRATGLARYFVGFGAGFPQADDLTVSYQFTGSTDFWDDPGRYDDGARRPSYISQSGRVALPVGVHQELEAAPSYVVQSEQLGQQTIATDIFELPLTYTTAVSNLLPGVHLGQLSVGVNFTTESRRTYFDALSVATGEADLFEVSGGWSDTFRDPFGSTAVGLRVVVNPGGVLGLNADHVWNSFTNGRVTSVEYPYGVIDLTRTTTLPARLTWVATLEGLASDHALPDADQISLGGLYGVRGYTLDDATADRGLYLRNELRPPPVSVLDRLAPAWRVQDQLAPFVFADYGTGHIDGAAVTSDSGSSLARTYTLASAGLGFDYQLGRHVTANALVGCALHDAILTHAGSCRGQARIFFSF
jgi:hemolysin activation/secretion protein